MKRPLLVIGLLFATTLPRTARAQAGALGELVAGLGQTGRVLVIGAHPDDEDTQMITWLARGRHVETAYLSLTRGDGGQNLIGNELGVALGAIRTEELLAARRLDGGRQYFTRAIDFGFSKNADETLEHWPRDSILKDVVAVVRAFRPQVIVAIWSGTPGDGHGHHQLAGMLAREVFDAAADTVRFPSRETNGLAPWTVSKFYRGAYRSDRSKASLVFNVGEYSPFAGRTYSEIATESRSQHASQGQGGLPQRGARLDFLALEAAHVPGVALAGAPARERSIFDGVDTTWARFHVVQLSPAAHAALDSLPAAIAAAQAQTMASLGAPAPAVAALARVVRLMRTTYDGAPCRGDEIGSAETPQPAACGGAAGDLANTLVTSLDRAQRALLLAAGVAVEATAPRELAAVGDTIPVTISVFDQGALPVRVGGASAALDGTSFPIAIMDGPTVSPDSAWRTSIAVRPEHRTGPWWLERPRKGDVFQITPPGKSVAPPMLTGEDRLAENRATVSLTVAGTPVTAVTTIVNRTVDPATGEVRRPLAAAPAIAVSLDREIEYARAGLALDRTVRVTVRSAVPADRDVTVTLDLPPGLTADSARRTVGVPAQGVATADFRVRGTLPVGRHEIGAVAELDGRRFTEGYVPIMYGHIRPIRLFGPARATIDAVDVKLPAGLVVAYVPGVGDNVAPTLQALGVDVRVIDPARLAGTDFSRFNTIVVGTRAFTNEALVAAAARLQDFARRGGTVVVQYGQAEMARPGILPYPIAAPSNRDRVTEENAPVRVLDPQSPLLVRPNRIDDRDFQGWVQERSLYMPRTFDAQWHALLSMNDRGEEPLESGILVAPVGRGTYVYTTLSFFRQLPAGNPGAARLFLNLLAADQRAATGEHAVAAPAPRP